MATAGDLARLAERLDKVADRLVEGVEGFVGLAITEIGAEVVIATRVVTGFHRGNWRPALNAQPTGPITFLDPTGAATIGRWQTVGSRYRAGDTFFGVNYGPAINDLNERVDPGFIQDAVRKGFDNAVAAQQAAGLF